MSGYSPDITVNYYRYLGDTATEITNYVEYDFSVNGGSSDFINAPLPSNSSIKLFFTDETIPAIQVGYWIEIVDNTLGVTWAFGQVTSRSSRYAAWGTAGYIVEWSYEFVGFISLLQKMSWYNPSTYTGDTSDCLSLIFSYAGLATWSQVTPTQTWAQVDPTTVWVDYDGYNRASSYMTVDGSNFQSQTLAAGWRNVWDDLVTLVYGVWGTINETNTAVVMTLDWAKSPSPISQNQIMVDVEATDNLPSLRNHVTITKYDNTSVEYRDQESIRQYGELPGSLTTFINNTSDANTTGAKIINGLSWPLFGISNVRFNLYNPNLTNTDIQALSGIPQGGVLSIAAPTPMGGTQDYAAVGYSLSANKNAWIYNINLVPYSVAINSINWNQVDPSYTWTSYGTAYPTQKWSDL